MPPYNRERNIIISLELSRGIDRKNMKRLFAIFKMCKSRLNTCCNDKINLTLYKPEVFHQLEMEKLNLGNHKVQRLAFKISYSNGHVRRVIILRFYEEEG